LLLHVGMLLLFHHHHQQQQQQPRQSLMLYCGSWVSLESQLLQGKHLLLVLLQ
jgi:UDP-2,3-diacylglucosamine pyrophosphatase LpxH